MRIGHGQAQKDLMAVDGDQAEREREEEVASRRPGRGGAPASPGYVLQAFLRDTDAVTLCHCQVPAGGIALWKNAIAEKYADGMLWT